MTSTARATDRWVARRAPAAALPRLGHAARSTSRPLAFRPTHRPAVAAYDGPVPPPDPAPALRASDEDRERVARDLRDHYSAGRLDGGELDDRLDRAYAARTLADLEPLTADLPTPASTGPTAAQRRKRHEFGSHLISYVLVNAMLVVIWAVGDSGTFWPGFVLAGWGIGLGAHAWDAFGPGGGDEDGDEPDPRLPPRSDVPPETPPPPLAPPQQPRR
jgi:hypothetical protein